MLSPSSSAPSISAEVGPCPSSASPRAAGPVELSAQRLHDLAVEAFRVGNRGRLSLCDALRVLSETRLYLELGFPSIAAYADTFFQLRRADAYEYVRVANALVELTELRDAFGQGRISWSVLKAVTRVATVGSQASWIDFARRHGGERTLAEARDAQRRGRDKPRDSSFGLPNLDQKLVLRFSRSDLEKVRGWIDSACATVAEKTGTEGISVEQALLFLCEKGMASEAGRSRSGDGVADEDNARIRSDSDRAQIVFQRCPDCRRARMGTREGFVEVESEEVERYEGCAKEVVIDGPTPPKLRRQILAREAGRCANPRCGNKADHCHHIEFQSKGGKTCLANEAAVCATCHALVHAGLLRVHGDANGKLDWSPRIAGDSLERDVEVCRDASGGLPVLQLVRGKSNRNGARGGGSESADTDSRPGSTARDCGAADVHSLDLEALAQGLVRLGVPAVRSRGIIGAVVEAQPPGELTEVGVLRKALAAI